MSEDRKKNKKLTIPLAIPSPIEFPTIPSGESIVLPSSSHEMKRRKKRKETKKKKKKEKTKKRKKEAKGNSRSSKDDSERKVKISGIPSINSNH